MRNFADAMNFRRFTSGGTSKGSEVGCTTNPTPTLSSAASSGLSQNFQSLVAMASSSSRTSGAGTPRRLSGAARAEEKAPQTSKPFEASQPSVVVVNTTSSGFMLGKVSGTNLPDEVKAVLAQQAAGKKDLLASTLIATLLSRGYTIASQSSAQGADAHAGSELIFTLIRQPTTRDTLRGAFSGSSSGGEEPAAGTGAKKEEKDQSFHI